MVLFLGKNLEAEASAQQAWHLIRLFRVMKPRLSNCLQRKLRSPLLEEHCLSPVSTQIMHYKVCIFCIRIKFFWINWSTKKDVQWGKMRQSKENTVYIIILCTIVKDHKSHLVTSWTVWQRLVVSVTKLVTVIRLNYDVIFCGCGTMVTICSPPSTTGLWGEQ